MWKTDFQKRLYLITGITFLIVAILFLANYWLMMRLTNLASQIQDRRRTLSFHSKSIEGEALLKADLLRAQRETGFLDNILPPPDNLIDFPRDISIWASQNGIDVGFSFVKQVDSANQEPGYATFVLTGEGTFTNIASFLRTIENGRYLIQFNQYDIVAQGNNYTLLINGQIFSR